MKSNLRKLLLAFTFAVGLMAITDVSQAYYRGYWGGGARYYHGGYYHHYYRPYYRCGWVSGYWANGYWYPAHRACW